MTALASHPANRQVAETFREVADLLDRAGDNLYRAAAYARAAESVADFEGDVGAIAATPEGLAALDALPGVGPDLAAKIREICTTGRLRLLVNLRARSGQAEPALRAMQGLGPARINQLAQDLGVTTVDGLRRALASGALAALPGFGPKLRARLARALAAGPADLRWPRDWAARQAEALAQALRRRPGVVDVVVAGSLRRGSPTVGDADLVVVTGPTADITDAVRRLPRVQEVAAEGEHRVSLRLVSGLGVDLLIAAPEAAGAALVHFTGSKAHNIGLRQRAKAMGLKLNEYGLFKGGRRVAGETEASVYAALGLAMPEPNEREDRPGD